MKKFFSRVKSLLPTRRRIIQLYTALLFNANWKGFSSGSIYKGNTKAFCAPGINCYSCPGAIAACPLGSLQGAFSADRSTLYYVGGIVLLYCVLLGRFICGWLCPFGLVQELLHKIPTPKAKKGPVTRALSWVKYVILVFFVGIVPITYALRDVPLPAFCKYICPAGTLEGGLALLSNRVNESYFSMLGPVFTWKFLMMVSILVGCVFVFRLFCRFICPLGALYGLFNRISVFGIRVDESKCIHCDKCIGHCKMDIRHVGDRECISCGDCIGVCPTRAIGWKGLTRRNAAQHNDHPRSRRITRAVCAVVMAAVLVCAIAFYWQQSPAVAAPEVGHEVGDSCTSLSLQRIGPDGLLDEKIDPSATGRITVINFWGTWCGPCVKELPAFDRIAADYADTVTVVAVHTAMVADTAPAFIAQYYPDSAIRFAVDEGEGFYGTFYTALGGRDTYPYTVVLDEQGIITHIFVSAVEYEDLQKAIEEIG